MCKDEQKIKCSVAKSYRVECNSGSKYFVCKDKAAAYFDYMSTLGFDATMWFMRIYYDEIGLIVKGEQILLQAETDDEIFEPSY